ncbi:MAG: hypothetical protein IK083_03080 [Abditibacteriota bacterium]|nr:hypothetical protein [Abditibacteriota bacterium]
MTKISVILILVCVAILSLLTLAGGTRNAASSEDIRQLAVATPPIVCPSQPAAPPRQPKRWEIKNDSPLERMGNQIPEEHLADKRFYSTRGDAVSRIIKYSHWIGGKPGRKGFFVDDILTGRDYFIAKFFEDPEDFARKYSEAAVRRFDGGFELTEYDIFEDAWNCDMLSVRPNPFYEKVLQVLRHRGKVIWADDHCRLLDVRSSGKGYIILQDMGVEYVSLENGNIVSDLYTKSFNRGFDKGVYMENAEYPIEEGKILTRNIVRIRYKSGYVVHFKVVISPEDFVNDYADIAGDDRQPVKWGFPSVVWHNDVKLPSAGPDHLPAWDIKDDTSREPRY